MLVVACLWFAFLSWHPDHSSRQGKKSSSPTQQKRQNVLNICVEVFYSTSFCFAVGMIIAAYAINTLDGRAKMHRSYFSSIAAQFTTMILVCLGPWYFQQNPRKTITSLVIVFLLMAFLSVQIKTMGLHKQVEDSDLEDTCWTWAENPNSKLPFHILMRRPYLMPLLLLGGSILFFSAIFFTDKWRQTRPTRLPIVAYASAKVLTALTSLGVMWFIFAVFIRLREHTRLVAGGSYSENEWTVGQVLALTAWLPMFFDGVGMAIRKFLSSCLLCPLTCEGTLPWGTYILQWGRFDIKTGQLSNADFEPDKHFQA